MSQAKKRLAKVEASLTPKQAALLWLQDAHRAESLLDYARSLRGRPDAEYPLYRLPDQVDQAVRAVMKGQNREVVDREVRRAVRDVVFLFHLHQQVNGQWEAGHGRLVALLSLGAERTAGLLRELAVSEHLFVMRERLNGELPYPLDRETVAALEAAERHRVVTWEVLDEVIMDWVDQHLVRQGRRRIPLGAYGLRPGSGGMGSAWPQPSEEELRSLFGDEEALAVFLAGEDYSFGLAGVRDEEFEALCDPVEEEIRALVAASAVETGVVVELPHVPIAGLQEAPLVEAEWIDRYLVELAEWGALLRRKGYQRRGGEDDHLLAWDRWVRTRDGQVLGVTDREIESVRAEARANLERFPCRTKRIDGRPYLHFEDYLAWKGRKAKGSLTREDGVLASSWNAWVAAHGIEGQAALAGVLVAKLPGVTAACAVVARDPAEAVERRRKRRELLASISGWRRQSPDGDGAASGWQSVGDRALHLEGLLERLLADVGALTGCCASVRRRYFGGQEVLFPAAAEELESLDEQVQALADLYRRSVVGPVSVRVEAASGPRDDGAAALGLDLEGVAESSEAQARQLEAGVVTRAKAEALFAMGEHEAGVKLLENRPA